jgi:type II restriction/modification system DNA methylase subunit YeeA
MYTLFKHDGKGMKHPSCVCDINVLPSSKFINSTLNLSAHLFYFSCKCIVIYIYSAVFMQHIDHFDALEDLAY